MQKNHSNYLLMKWKWNRKEWVPSQGSKENYFLMLFNYMWKLREILFVIDCYKTQKKRWRSSTKNFFSPLSHKTPSPTILNSFWRHGPSPAISNFQGWPTSRCTNFVPKSTPINPNTNPMMKKKTILTHLAGKKENFDCSSGY